MGKTRLGDFIRETDFFVLTELEANARGNQMIDLGQEVSHDLDIDELKDGFAAYREKIGVPDFPERHSDPYRAASSIISCLNDLVGKFDKDENGMQEFGRVYMDTWLTLLQARPSSGHVDLMEKLQTKTFERYIKICGKEEFKEVFSRMKITFRYDPEVEINNNERVYADRLHKGIRYLFKHIEQDQLIAAQPEFIDLYQHYQKQLAGLSKDLTTYMNYLLRDMKSGYPDKNPFMQTSSSGGGKTDSGSVKATLESLQSLICDQHISSQGQFEALRAEETIKGVLKTVSQNNSRSEHIEPLMSLLMEFAKSPSAEYGKRVFDAYRYDFFEKMDKEKYVPDAKVFETILDAVIVVINEGRLTEAVQLMMKAMCTACLLKFDHVTPVMAKKMVNFIICLLKTGEPTLIHITEFMLREKIPSKHFVWKDYIEEVKTMLYIIGQKPTVDMDNSGPRDALSAYEDFCEYLLKALKKAKVEKQVQKELVETIFDCIELDNPEKSQIADELCRDLTLIKPLKEVVVAFLERIKTDLLNKQLTWDSDCANSIQEILEAIVRSYNENGKLVTPEQHKLFMDIFNIVMEGDTTVGHFLDDEDSHTVFLRIYQSTVILYYVAHRDSSTTDCLLQLIPGIIKWARISTEENCEVVRDTSFILLQNFTLKPPKGMEKYLKDLLDLMFEAEQYLNLSMLITKLYPDNPKALHDRLPEIFETYPMLKDDNQMMVLNILMPVASTNPQAFTPDQIKTLIDWHLNPGQQDSLILVVIRSISDKKPRMLLPHGRQFLKPDKGTVPMVFSMKLYVIGNVAVLDQKLAEDSLDFMVKCFNHPDPNTLHVLTGQIYTVMKASPKYMNKYRGQVEKLESTATTPGIRDGCKKILNFLDGKVIEEVYEDVQQTKEDVEEIDKKVGATIDTVVTLGEHVVEHHKDISKLQTDVGDLEERVDDVEEDLGETKVKVEEIDNKTMTNAPKWSRDLTKLMNPQSDADWRLLAQRLEYSNDDIRAWAQQNDPCMAMLSEWYATHKTSEATHAILKNLEEMNREDAVIIVENAMKATEGVVEDEEFEYPSPPPIFLSYQWGVQDEVKLLKQHLQMAGFECWMDIGQMGGGDKLFKKIDNGVRSAKLVISCVTEKYAKSPNCNREVNLSVNLGKPIIPLLMEKMPWPPEGSMGPIFGEYLFIRFFQRGGEETKDNRYWPLPKFKELLMQINFFVAPDQKLITKEYKNWWMPMTEEIIINKNKGKGKTAASQPKTETKPKEANSSPEVFLSYQWGKQPEIQALYQRLTSLGYTIWMDIHQMGGGDSLYDKIDRGMRGCKAVVSCVTPKYSLSANCRREISLADALKKPIIPLLLEQMKWPPDGPMSMVFTELLYINMYKDENIQKQWKGEKFDELLQKLQQHIPSIQAVPIGQAKKEASGNKGKPTNTRPASIKQVMAKQEHQPSDAKTKPVRQDTANQSAIKPESNNQTNKDQTNVSQQHTKPSSAKRGKALQKHTPNDSEAVLDSKSGTNHTAVKQTNNIKTINTQTITTEVNTKQVQREETKNMNDNKAIGQMNDNQPNTIQSNNKPSNANHADTKNGATSKSCVLL